MVPSAPEAELSADRPGRTRLPGVVYLLGAVAFLMGTSEMIISGLLPEVADGLRVTDGNAGLLITAFAAGMIIGAPVMSMATLRLAPGATLVIALLVFAAGHAVAAFNDNYAVWLIARFFSGAVTGTFWAVGAVLAAAAAGRAASVRATAIIAGGLTLANVLGVPIGTALGQWLGWRAPFWGLAALAVAAAAVLAVTLPAAARGTASTLAAEISSLRKARLWLIYLGAVLLPASFVCVYGYIAPLLTDRAGLAAPAVPLVMFGYGLAGVLGAVFGGRFGDRGPFRVAIPSVILIAVILAALTLWGASTIAAIVLFVLLGGVAMVAQPILIATAGQVTAPTNTLAIALTVSSLNVGIALGSWSGGLMLSSPLGFRGPSLLGTGVAVLAAVALAAAAASAKRSAPSG
ncbi:MFS transporter [Amycolatopsis sp. GM8]|uniref:MFS transporter n=1 Tax=Amycolatopsis sp. GM8 TaxID=2896530 RepID=UPI001F437BB1|nr:MFS transporter [Amycolatopsis sp. GM8]